MNCRQIGSLLLTTLLLAGCGRVASPLAPARAGVATRQVVGLPGGYQPGGALGGLDAAPSLREGDLPRFTATKGGTSSDPVNLMIAASERQIHHVFGSRGWLEADKLSAITAARTIKAALTGTEYPTSPMSDLYLYSRVQDLALQKNAQSVRARDHLRVWRTPLKDHLGRPFWAVAATKDVAIKWGPTDKIPTHQISPDLDAERQFVVNDFLASGHVAERYQLQSLSPNFKGRNGSNDEMYSDGRVEVLELVLLKEH